MYNDVTICGKQSNLHEPGLQVNKPVLSNVANSNFAETVSNIKSNGVNVSSDGALIITGNESKNVNEMCGIEWPERFGIKQLIPDLLSREGTVTQTLKRHIRYMHKFLKFTDDGTERLPVSLVATYEKLINNLTELGRNLKLSA